jgi:hypothetical protein
MKNYLENVKDIINKKVECPLPLMVIPNNMGINLCSVDAIGWQKQEDGQLTSLTIYFLPNEKAGKVAEIKAWCATNEIKPKSVHDISFEDTKADSYQHWLKTQMIRRCKIIIYDK